MKKINLACIIEDDPVHQLLTQNYVKLTGMVDNLMLCKNGMEAYNLLKSLITAGETVPELILLDLNMPIWDGWQFLEEFIKIPVDQKITIFILTSSINEDDFRKAEMFDLTSNYLIKPIKLEKLKSVLSELF
ncbi:response regulator [Salegentibacter sp. LM13S]|uniref:response regulator n=1 Tax=Salegentibacter lacus TaxID=2873599 RepID=UPI001CCB829A|nr:response regulator [Salegentibacter lacus]MBZ9631265.1 response regulator [Salegentibacter lacus]